MNWDVYRWVEGAGDDPYTPISFDETLVRAIEIAEGMVEWLFVGDYWHWECRPQMDPISYGAIVLDEMPTRAAILVVPHGIKRSV